jgi:hypothetical protein
VIKPVRIAATLLVCLFGVSSLAHADFLDWIDELSGPGPFWGLSVDARLYCFGIDKSTPNATLGADADDVNKVCLVNRVQNSTLSNKRTVVTFNMTAGIAWSKQNHLTYADGTTHGVNLAWFEPAVWVLPIPQVAVGASVGLDRFFSRDDNVFDAFSRGYVRPQVEIKPFDFPKGPHPASLRRLTLRLSAEIIPHSFDAKDFGAIAGLNTNHEVLKSFAVVYDFPFWLR